MTQKTGCSGPKVLVCYLSPTGESGTNTGGKDGGSGALHVERSHRDIVVLWDGSAGSSVTLHICLKVTVLGSQIYADGGRFAFGGWAHNEI